MAIEIPSDEEVIERVESLVEGKSFELVLTDQAVYFESMRSPLRVYATASVASLLHLLGLLVNYYIMRSGQVFVRYTLDRIDSVTTRLVPLPLIPQLGGLVTIVFSVAAYLQWNSWWYAYGVGLVFCALTSLLMIRFQRAYLVISSLNNNFEFQSFKTLGELIDIQNKIWQARNNIANKALPKD